MDTKKIIIICMCIVMVSLIFGAVYLESKQDAIIQKHYEIETEDFSYDDETLIINNMIIEDAEDVNYSNGTLEYIVHENGEPNSTTPLFIILAIFIAILMFFVYMD